MKLLDLSCKPLSEQFTEKEIKFIKSKKPKKGYEIKYCIYNMVSKNNTYIGFIIDAYPFATRRSGYMNQWKVICTRPLTNIEYDEQDVYKLALVRTFAKKQLKKLNS